MEIGPILSWCVIGILAGYAASFIVGGAGVLRYLVTGLIGAFVGGFLMDVSGLQFSLGNPFATQIAVAAIGAVVVGLLGRILV